MQKSIPIQMTNSLHILATIYKNVYLCTWNLEMLLSSRHPCLTINILTSWLLNWVKWFLSILSATLLHLHSTYYIGTNLVIKLNFWKTIVLIYFEFCILHNIWAEVKQSSNNKMDLFYLGMTCISVQSVASSKQPNYNNMVSQLTEINDLWGYSKYTIWYKYK